MRTYLCASVAWAARRLVLLSIYLFLPVCEPVNAGSSSSCFFFFFTDVFGLLCPPARPSAMRPAQSSRFSASSSCFFPFPRPLVSARTNVSDLSKTQTVRKKKGVGAGEDHPEERQRRLPDRPERAVPRAAGGGYGGNGLRSETQEQRRGGEARLKRLLLNFL